MDLMFVWLLRHYIGVGATNTTINKYKRKAIKFVEYSTNV